MKVNETGAEEWNRTYGTNEREVANEIIHTNDGGYALVGTKGPVIPNEADSDVLLLKIASDGTEQWNRTYGGVESDRGHSVVQATDGGFAIAARSSSFGVFDANNAWLIKTATDGTEEWNQTYVTDVSIAFSITKTADGGYALGGMQNFDFLLVKVTSDGTEQWNATYPNESFGIAYSVIETADGEYVLGGWQLDSLDFDARLMKTGSAGPIEVSIDVKPGSDPNAINPNSEGVVPVAVLNTTDFDPTREVDVSTLRFGAPDEVDAGDGATPAHAGHVEDVDDDGDDDLVVHFPTEDTGFEEGDDTGKLVGETVDGTPLFGTDSVEIVGGGSGP